VVAVSVMAVMMLMTEALSCGCGGADDFQLFW